MTRNIDIICLQSGTRHWQVISASRAGGGFVRLVVVKPYRRGILSLQRRGTADETTDHPNHFARAFSPKTNASIFQ